MLLDFYAQFYVYSDVFRCFLLHIIHPLR